MRGINAKGRIQKSFITPLDLWEATATKAQKDDVAVSDVLRAGMQAYLDGELTITNPWGRKKDEDA